MDLFKKASNSRKKETLFLFYVTSFISFFLVFSACDQTFDPIQENDKYYFSIYGYLDAAADTQWVRIAPARQDINEKPDPNRIKVILEDIHIGKTEIMNDSLFSSDGFLNYWTTMEIDNEKTYSITVERADGKSSYVKVTTPEKIPSPYVLPNVNPPGYNIYIDDTVEHIADVQSVWYIILNPETDPERRIYKFGIRDPLKYTGTFDGTYFAFANHEEELNQIEQRSGSAEIFVANVQFFIAAAGPQWNEAIPDIEDAEYFLNEVASNVENGLGYVVGIDSKWINQGICLDPKGVKYVKCEPREPFW